MDDDRAMARELGRAAGVIWWVLLVTGVLWLIAGLVVLRFDTTSLVTVGVILGVYLCMGSASELFRWWARDSLRWLHFILGIVFALGAIWCFARPINAFWALAACLGFLLVLKGTLDVVEATASRGVNSLWVLGVIVGIAEILLGFWASQRYYPARAELILVLVGFMALFRGIADIVAAFSVRRLGKELALA